MFIFTTAFHSSSSSPSLHSSSPFNMCSTICITQLFIVNNTICRCVVLYRSNVKMHKQCIVVRVCKYVTGQTCEGNEDVWRKRVKTMNMCVWMNDTWSCVYVTRIIKFINKQVVPVMHFVALLQLKPPARTTRNVHFLRWTWPDPPQRQKPSMIHWVFSTNWKKVEKLGVITPQGNLFPHPHSLYPTHTVPYVPESLPRALRNISHLLERGHKLWRWVQYVTLKESAVTNT
jgi:hypothetical protein